MFAKNLSSLRRNRKLTQYELAKELGYSRGQIANYEQGQREPDYGILVKIADFFSVSVDYLIGHESKNQDIFDKAEVIMFKDYEGFESLPLEEQEEIKKSISDQVEYLIYKSKKK